MINKNNFGWMWNAYKAPRAYIVVWMSLAFMAGGSSMINFMFRNYWGAIAGILLYFWSIYAIQLMTLELYKK